MRSTRRGRDLRSAGPALYPGRDPFLSRWIIEAGFVCLTLLQPDYITNRSQKWTAADSADTEQLSLGNFFFFFFFSFSLFQEST